MDIYAEVKSFSFYESSRAIYVNVRIIEKRLKKIIPNHKVKFEEVQIGDIITLKTDRKALNTAGNTNLESLVQLLLNRFLIFDIGDWEEPTQGFKNSNPKFLITNAQTCVTLMEN